MLTVNKDKGSCQRDILKRRNSLKHKIRTKRNIVIFIWSVAFAYLSLTAEEADSANVAFDLPQNLRAVAPSAVDYGDTVPSQGGVGILRAAGGDASGVAASESSNNNENYAGKVHSATNVRDKDELVDVLRIAGVNCTPPGIDEFPTDLFTQETRRQGAVAVHFIVSIYVFYALALVCDDYFVPAIECICDELKLSSDVAGASFMAIATSSPELFTNVIGTFITESDLGVGTILGSAVFNILAVGACCGLAATAALPLDWYPLTRDCIFYSISVVLLIFVLNNRQVFWYEGLILVMTYIVYLGVMYKNIAFKSAAENVVHKIGSKFGWTSWMLVPSRRVSLASNSRRVSIKEKATSEQTPLLDGSGGRSGRTTKSQSYDADAAVLLVHDDDINDNEDMTTEAMDEILIAKALHKSEEDSQQEKAEWGLFRLPFGQGCFAWTEWILGWPAHLFLTCTVPDCREKRLRKLYPLTFIMCIVWIAGLSYVVAWMMTIIGYTLRVPDSIMGLTFIAAGTSVPEAVSSIIVARQGLGTMSISNSIGSNTFDILICLGLPWLIRGSMMANDEINYIQINSGGLEYSAMILMVSLLCFYFLLAFNGFSLSKRVAVTFLVMYSAFLIFASLFELNVFYPVNPPTCET